MVGHVTTEIWSSWTWISSETRKPNRNKIRLGFSFGFVPCNTIHHNVIQYIPRHPHVTQYITIQLHVTQGATIHYNTISSNTIHYNSILGFHVTQKKHKNNCCNGDGLW
jgi:hypothetical protein